MHLNQEFTRPNQFVNNGLVIGPNVNDRLAPIFDITRVMIVVRNGQNILLRPEDTWIFPFIRPVNNNPEYLNYSPSKQILDEMFNRLKECRSQRNVGIAFFQKYFNGPLVKVLYNWPFLRQHQVVWNGLVIGLNVHDKLVPIFDVDGKMIVVRELENVRLYPQDAGILPYHRPLNRRLNSDSSSSSHS